MLHEIHLFYTNVWPNIAASAIIYLAFIRKHLKDIKGSVGILSKQVSLHHTLWKATINVGNEPGSSDSSSSSGNSNQCSGNCGTS